MSLQIEYHVKIFTPSFFFSKNIKTNKMAISLAKSADKVYQKGLRSSASRQKICTNENVLSYSLLWGNDTSWLALNTSKWLSYWAALLHGALSLSLPSLPLSFLKQKGLFLLPIHQSFDTQEEIKRRRDIEEREKGRWDERGQGGRGEGRGANSRDSERERLRQYMTFTFHNCNERERERERECECVHECASERQTDRQRQRVFPRMEKRKSKFLLWVSQVSTAVILNKTAFICTFNLSKLYSCIFVGFF